MSRTRPKDSSDDVIAQLAPLRRYARALTRDETQAEDLVQDALVRAYERRSTFRPGANLRNWLLSILHNAFIDTRRRKDAELRREGEAAQLAEMSFPAEQQSSVYLQQIGRAFFALPDARSREANCEGWLRAGTWSGARRRAPARHGPGLRLGFRHG